MWWEECRHGITSVLLCKTSVAGVALSKIVQTLKKLQAVFWVPVRFSAWLMPNAQKEKPSAHSLCAKGDCLAVPPFLMLVFLAYLRDLLTWIGREDLLQSSACRFKSYLPYLLSFRFLSACRESLSGGALVCTPLSHNLFLFSL